MILGIKNSRDVVKQLVSLLRSSELLSHDYSNLGRITVFHRVWSENMKFV